MTRYRSTHTPPEGSLAESLALKVAFVAVGTSVAVALALGTLEVLA